MSASNLQSLLDSTVAQFNEVKKDGSLTLPEVVKIATTVFKGVYALENVSKHEKKAFVLMALERGISAAGPLQGLSHVDPAIVSEVEKQALHLAVSAVFGLEDAFPHAFAEVQGALSYIRRSLSKCLPACSQAAVTVSVLDPKDAALIAEAVKAAPAFAAPPAPLLEVRSVETSQVSVAPSSSPAPAV